MSFFDTGARFDRDHPRHADASVSGNPAQTTVDDSGDLYPGAEAIASNDAGEGWPAINQRDTYGGPDATVLNLPHPDTRDPSNGQGNLAYADPIEALGFISEIAKHLEACYDKVTAHEDMLIKKRMRGPQIVTFDWANATPFSVQVSNPVPEGEIWLISPVTAFITIAATGLLAAVQAVIFTDAPGVQANFVALVDGSRATWGNENLMLQAGQTLWATSLANAAQNNKVTIRAEVLAVSADMVDTHAQF